MKIQYSIYQIEEILVCTPVEYRYGEGDNWCGEHIETLRLIVTKDTFQKCVQYLENVLLDVERYNKNERYTILTEYVNDQTKAE